MAGLMKGSSRVSQPRVMRYCLNKVQRLREGRLWRDGVLVSLRYRDCGCLRVGQRTLRGFREESSTAKSKPAT